MNHRPYQMEQRQNISMHVYLKSMMNESQVEFKKFDGSDETVIYLQQAGEKLFNALGMYIQITYDMMSGSHYATMNMIKEKPLSDLFQRANSLHNFFYEGEAGDYRRDFIKSEYSSIYENLKGRLTSSHE